MNELTKRILIALIFIPLLLWILYHGALPLVLLFLVFSALGFYEYKTMMTNANISIGWFWIPIHAMLYLAIVYTRSYDVLLLWLVVFVIMLQYLLGWAKNQRIDHAFAILFGMIYTGIFPGLIVRIGLDYSVQKILLALILMIWIVDSVAYFFGMKFGKHRNVTAISPRKSMEGFVAGALVPWVVLAVYYFLGFRPVDMLYMCIIAVASGIIGQLGDLCESMLKRYCGVKDSSGFIPGHGGVLDRMDSVLFAGSFLYCALVIF